MHNDPSLGANLAQEIPVWYLFFVHRFEDLGALRGPRVSVDLESRLPAVLSVSHVSMRPRQKVANELIIHT